MTNNPYEAPQTILSGENKTADAHARWQVIVQSMKEGARVGAFLPGGIVAAVGFLLLGISLSKGNVAELPAALGIWLVVFGFTCLAGGILGGAIGLFAGLVVLALGFPKVIDTSVEKNSPDNLT
ncbi:MAG: hypothetical protein SFX18_08875 [Pirellulales bacterium]|nr:hypothetical protein [Pirellulales bacterium]